MVILAGSRRYKMVAADRMEGALALQLDGQFAESIETRAILAARSVAAGA
jgi:hypothetical protein